MIAMIAKEIRILLRSRKAFWFMELALLVVGSFFSFYWTVMSQSAMTQVNQRVMLGRTFFMIVSVVQLCAMGLISPLMASTTVTIERENKTLDLLLATGLSRLRLLLGKWFATIYYQLVLLLCLLPILSLVFQLGGVVLDEYLFAAAMITLTVLTYGMLGLACSCIFRRSTGALVATLMLVLLLACGLPLLLGLLASLDFIDSDSFSAPFRGRLNSATNPIDYLFWSVSPVMAWVQHLARLDLGSAAAAKLNHSWLSDPRFVAHLIFQGALFLVSLWLAWRGFGHRIHERSGNAKAAISDPAELTRRRHRWPYYLIDPLRRAQAIGDRQNPVYVKEQRVGVLARPHVLIRVGYLCLPLSAVILSPFFEGDIRKLLQGPGAYILTLVMLIVPIFAATALSREREEGTMDLLRTTPLRPGQIVCAKFLITLRFAAVMILGLLFMPLLVRLIATLYHPRLWDGGAAFLGGLWDNFLLPAGRLGVTLFSFSAFFIAVGIYFSSRQRRNMGAITVTYLTLALAAFLPFFLYLVNHEGYHDRIDSISLFTCYIAPLINPYYYLNMDSYNRIHHYVDWSRELSATQSARLLGHHTTMMILLTAALLWRATRRIAKERQS